MSSLMKDYNYHDWTKYMVQRPEEAPTGPHFAGVMFNNRTEYTPAYDSRDSASSCTVPEVLYFAFPSVEVLTEWASRAVRNGKHIFFFEVKAMGRADVKVDVNVAL